MGDAVVVEADVHLGDIRPQDAPLLLDTEYGLALDRHAEHYVDMGHLGSWVLIKAFLNGRVGATDPV